MNKGVQKNLFKHLKENFLNMVNIRLIILTVFFVALGALMIYRVFDLQIIRGEDYLNDFQLKTTKVRSLASTGEIFMTVMVICSPIMNWLTT